MFGFLGKKKKKEVEVAQIFVAAIYNVIDQVFDDLCAYINEDKEFETPPQLSRKDIEQFFLIVMAANFINFPKYFEPEQEIRLKAFILDEIAKLTSKSKDEIDSILTQYEAYIKEQQETSIDMSKSMAKALFFKLGLNEHQKEHFRKMQIPNPIFFKEFNQLTCHYLWNWEDYLAKVKVVS